MKVVSWNIENLGPWLAPERAGELEAQVRALGDPDVVCLQEIRVRPRDTALIEAVQRVLPAYVAAVALCDDPRNVSYRGGRAYGVATFVKAALGPVTSTTPGWDREGRVLETRLEGAGLRVINLYAVNGTSKPYVDPETGQPAGDRHAHKRRFQDRVFELAGGAGGDGGDGAVLAGDWNVSRTALDTHPRLRTEEPHARARAELNAHLARGWVDAYRHLHPDARGYSWFARWSKRRLDAARVDYIVIAADLVPQLEAAEIHDDPALRPGSDHAPVSITLRSRG